MSTPTLFLSHGAPPLADDARWTAELAAWAAGLPRPESILMVSAHWEAAPTTVSASAARVPLVYDFWGFPQHYYEVTYAAPPAPALADAVSRVLGEAGEAVRRHEGRGLDHGAYVPLVEMYPDADIPVLQLSLPTLDPSRLLDLGRRLRPLRDEGVMVVGSGFTTHNLRWANLGGDPDVAPTPASAEFDHWAAETVAAGDLDTLVQFGTTAPAAREAHPRAEHWAPLYVALGAAGDPAGRSVVDGFWHRLSKRSWQFS